MSNERFFRLLSVAFLGAVALSFIPDTGAETAVVQATSSYQAPVPVDVEILSVNEINEINSGKFQPFIHQTGDEGDSRETAALEALEMLSQAH